MQFIQYAIQGVYLRQAPDPWSEAWPIIGAIESLIAASRCKGTLMLFSKDALLRYAITSSYYASSLSSVPTFHSLGSRVQAE